jgi:hypothetical protein
MQFVAQGAAQHVESARVAIVFIAIGIVVFWRVVLRLVLALIMIAILVAVGSGVLVFMHGAHA